MYAIMIIIPRIRKGLPVYLPINNGEFIAHIGTEPFHQLIPCTDTLLKTLRVAIINSTVTD